MNLRSTTFAVLWLTVFTYPWQASLIIPGLGSINKLLGIALIAVAILAVLVKKEIKRPPSIFGIIALFVIWNFLSYFWAADQSKAIEKGLLFLQLVVLAWVIFEFCTEKTQVFSLMQAYVLGCLVIAIPTIYEYYTSTGFSTNSRFFLQGYNPNNLGAILAVGIPISCFLYSRASKLYLFYVPVATFAVIIMASRAVAIVLAFLLVAIVWLLIRYRVKYRVFALVLLILAGYYVFNKIPEGQFNRISSIKTELTSGTLSERTIIWQGGLQAFSESPIIGVGAGSYIEATHALTGLAEGYNAHNTFISILVENGLIGILLFLIMLCYLIKYALSLPSRTGERWMALTLLIAWVITSMSSHSEAQKYVWIMFAFIITLFSLRNAPEKEKVPLKGEKLYSKRNIITSQ